VRRAWLILIFASGCQLHFEDHVRELARETNCCPDFQITELRSWAFRVQSCGAVSYWRCSVADSECCWPVATEREATQIVTSRPVRKTCWEGTR
jgi:hypothetical protein